MPANQNDNENEKTPMTKAQAAKLVRRVVPKLDDKDQPIYNKEKELVTKKVAIKEDEILNFAEYPDRVVVVTVTGEKLVADL